MNTLILAANYEHARLVARARGLKPREWKYVHDGNDFRGYDKPHILQYATFGNMQHDRRSAHTLDFIHRERNYAISHRGATLEYVEESDL